MHTNIKIPKLHAESNHTLEDLNESNYLTFDESLPNTDSAVAVIGMACKFAGSDSLEQFWNILETGTSFCSDLPSDRFPDWRFDRRQYPKNFKANTTDDVDAFDHKFFKISSREAALMDPQQRLALQVTYQALESSGYFNHDTETEQDIGCYMATCMNEYHENVACHPPSAFSLTGSIRPFIAGKISHHFNWTGPAIMFDTACAASGTAVHQACRAVATGECNTAIAGATNIFVSPDTFQNLAAGHFISTTGASKSFDASGDGYCRGECVAVVVLKKLLDAIRDGDPIRGIIAATAVNQNSNETNITVPHGPSQMKLYQKALKLAGLHPHDISYVEAHGTGTPKGDPIEAESIRGVFGKSPRDHRLGKTYFGSLKSNIGHTEATSGLSGLLKVILMMQKGIIPRQVLLNNLNPNIAPLEPSNLEIPLKNIPWDSKFKAACVNNYGASGTNAVMVVTQPPRMILSKKVSVATYPICITVFSASSLASYCSALLDFINQANNDLALKDISYNLSLRKNLNLPFSRCGTVSSITELKALLAASVAIPPLLREAKQRPVVLFFRGQGGNTPSVPRSLYDSFAIFQKHFDNCEEILEALGAPSIFPAIFLSETQDDIVLSNLMLFSAQYATAKSWIECGLKPSRLIGHSFGQLTALCVSGVLSLHDGLQLVTGRARLIKEQWGDDPGCMIAIQAPSEMIASLLAQYDDSDLEIACYNGPRSFVVAGPTASIEILEHTLSTLRNTLRWKRLQTTNAFHSVLADPLIRPIQTIAEQLDFHKPSIHMETCSKHGPWTSMTPALVAAHTRHPVYFQQAVERISNKLGPCTWLEAGSGSNVGLLRRALGNQAAIHDIKSLNLNSASSVDCVAGLTADLWKLGHKVQFWAFQQNRNHQHQLMNLPPYQFDKNRHWLEWKSFTPPVDETQYAVPEKRKLLELVRKTEDEGEFRIDTQCEEWQEKCSENKIVGFPICPLSFLLESVFKAVDNIRDAFRAKQCHYEIQNFATENSISAQAGELTVNISKIDERMLWAFVISRFHEPGHVYITGTLSATEKHSGEDFLRFGRLVDTTRIDDLASDLEADSIRGKAVYKSISNLFKIPRAAQKIREVCAKGREATGYLTSLSGPSLEAVEHFIQVPLLSLNSLQDRQSDEIYTNTSMGQAKFRSPDLLLQETSLSVYVLFFDPEGSDKTCDIFVFDAQKADLFAIILDVTFTKRNIEALRQSLSGIAMLAPSPRLKSHYVEPTKALICPEPCLYQIIEPEPYLDDDLSVQSNELSDITQPLFDILVRIADVDADALRCDVLLGSLGIDSLMGMEVAEEIANIHSVHISMAEFASAADVGSLCRLVADKANACAYDSDVSTLSDVLDEAESKYEGAFKIIDALSSRLSAPDESFRAITKAFDVIRYDFDIFAKDAGCSKFWSQVYPSQLSLVVFYITEAFAKLECDLSLIPAGEKIPSVPHIPQSDKLIIQMFRALQDDGLVIEREKSWIRTSKPLSPETTSFQRFDNILVDFPQFGSRHKLLHVIGSRLDECLSGTLSPISLFFGTAEKRELMADQYLSAPIQSTHQVVRVLEIGGGTCGTSLHAVKAFADLGVAVEYTFTDISTSFVTSAKSKLGHHKFVAYRTLDITQPPPSGLRQQFDMIIATNVMHATPDACVSAENARQMLRSGGFLTLVEYTRKLYLLDVIFGHFDGWSAFDDGREHPLMDKQEWKIVLGRAGFENIDWTGGKTRESEILRILLAY